MANTSKNRYLNSDSEWMRSFACNQLKVLIVCRGPIRKETMDIIDGLGGRYGILLSEKDSVTYPQTLAPELRQITDDDCVHRVPDYTGANGEERKERIAQIIQIAKDHNYTHVFAGYGFMAEDAEFVEKIENAGVGFVGPKSSVHLQAGAKDTAKAIAREAGVSVTPGIDNISALTLIRKANNRKALEKLAADNNLNLEPADSDEEYAESLLHAGYRAGIGFITLEELQSEATLRAEIMFRENANNRIRLKYIGGGGGKGQRIIGKADEASDAVVEVLQESKVLGEASNRNFLMELNIEHTRHNEIQLIGNGDWAIALGGRDCSLQMHEQKLVELSITDELFDYEIKLALDQGKNSIAEQLKTDRKTLQAMEDQAEKFGKAVGLNSASTFECILSGDSFYFMEMNTRIQVEHRVTEMAYSLKFSNPDNANDFFIVESLVEAMLLCAAHATQLPRPERVNRNIAGGEVRLNAMNDALQPHAGGSIQSWSAPVAEEIRDDQGIGVLNPDTGLFMHYYLAGDYDSNIALVVSYGENRRENLENLSDILRRMEIRGEELKTNREFHYGILNFCLGMHPMLKPDTSFVVPYLAAVGNLTIQLESFQMEAAWKEINKTIGSTYDKAGLETLNAKQTLLGRLLHAFLNDAHATAGWLVRNNGRAFIVETDRIVWLRNPLFVLADMYHYIHLETRVDASPVHQIWVHDQELMDRGLKFYKDLEAHLGIDTESDYARSLREDTNHSTAYNILNEGLLAQKNTFTGSDNKATLDNELWQKCSAAHRGWQSGMTLLDLLVRMGANAGLFEFGMNDKLEPIVPERFQTKEAEEIGMKALAPPPAASADTLVAVSGGMYYAKETPDTPAYLEVGKHFEVGQPLYIIEVMKMFNKVFAEFSGIVTEVLQEGADGAVVKKGDPLFHVKPDHEIVIETDEDKIKRRTASTLELLKTVKI